MYKTPLHLEYLNHHQTPLSIATEMQWKATWVEDGLQHKLVPSSIEKNWLTFSKNNILYSIASISPFIVLQETSDRSGNTVEVVKATIPILKNTGVLPISFHGGANPILINPPINRSSLSYLNRPPYYLGAFHTLPKTNLPGDHWYYLNYLFEFDAELPFQILRISEPLPLLTANSKDDSIGRPMAFLSGLTLMNDRLLISYGSSNQESRILSLNREGLEQLFPIPLPSHLII